MLGIESLVMGAEYARELGRIEQELNDLDQALKSLKNISASVSGTCSDMSGSFIKEEEWAGEACNNFCNLYDGAFMGANKKYADNVENLVADVESARRERELEKERLIESVQQEINRHAQEYM